MKNTTQVLIRRTRGRDTHAMPKNLLVDEVVRIGQGVLSAVSDASDSPKKEAEGGVHG